MRWCTHTLHVHTFSMARLDSVAFTIPETCTGQVTPVSCKGPADKVRTTATKQELPQPQWFSALLELPAEVFHVLPPPSRSRPWESGLLRPQESPQHQAGSTWHTPTSPSLSCCHTVSTSCSLEGMLQKRPGSLQNSAIQHKVIIWNRTI